MSNPKDSVIDVLLTFDMKTGSLKMNANCPEVMLLGILGMAQGSIIKTQMLRAMELAEQAKIRIVSPDQMPKEAVH